MATRRLQKAKASPVKLVPRLDPRIEPIEGEEDGRRLRVAVVVAEFNEDITERLLEGAVETFLGCGVKPENLSVLRVPGAWELPLAVNHLLGKGPKRAKFHAILALGAVIRGDTPHFEFVCSESARGLMEAGMRSGVVVTFGVLTTDDAKQAQDRAGGTLGNKGSETALAAVKMANLFRKV
jgi:6,7-dimethyl-8-ribityllumazine synthase